MHSAAKSNRERSQLFDLGGRAGLADVATGPFLLFALITVAKAPGILFVVQILPFVLRRHQASARHLILSSAMILLLLLPLAWWAPALYGPDFDSPFVFTIGETRVAHESAQAGLAPLGQPVADPTIARTMSAVATLSTGFVWAGGAAVLLIRLLIGPWRVRFPIREAHARPDDGDADPPGTGGGL